MCLHVHVSMHVYVHRFKHQCHQCKIDLYAGAFLPQQLLEHAVTELRRANEICAIARDEKDIVSHCVSCVFVQSSPAIRPAE